jgi:hypothetical protein
VGGQGYRDPERRCASTDQRPRQAYWFPSGLAPAAAPAARCAVFPRPSRSVRRGNSRLREEHTHRGATPRHPTLGGCALPSVSASQHEATERSSTDHIPAAWLPARAAGRRRGVRLVHRPPRSGKGLRRAPCTRSGHEFGPAVSRGFPRGGGGRGGKTFHVDFPPAFSS